MSRERINEHFSDMLEGKLDTGLSQQIQGRMDMDPDLREDFDKFSKTFALLETMKDETVEVPSFLSSRIADRMEANVTKPSFSFGSLFQKFGLGALAVIVVGGGVIAITNRNAGTAVQAGAIPTMDTPRKVLDTVEIKMVKDEPNLVFSASGPKTVTVVNAKDQTMVKKFDVTSTDSLSCPLENPGPEPVVFVIEATGDKTKHMVVLPGTGSDFEAKGSGELVSFAKVMAQKFNKTIYLTLVKDQPADLDWDITEATASAAASTVLPPTAFSVSTSRDGIVHIQQF
jgi:hypothetical protein